VLPLQRLHRPRRKKRPPTTKETALPPINIRRAALALVLLLAAGAAGRAAELPADAWPQFRRDAGRTGDNPQAALAFPLTRTTAVRLPAPIYASPAVVQGKVYVQDARGNVACIDAAANRGDWVTPLGGINNTSSPAVAAGKVFVGNSAGVLFILDARSGKVLHQVPAAGGVLTAPALANDAVYFSTVDGKLVKIDHAGKVVWTFNGGRLSTTEFALRGQEILFFAGSSNTFLYRLLDEGTAVKVVRKLTPPSNCCPMAGPVFVGGDGAFAFQSFDSESGRFYVMSADGKPLTATDVSDSRVLPAVRGDLLYRGDKCFSAANPRKPIWRANRADLYDGGFHSSPALARDVLVVGCERGLVHCFDLEGPAVRKPRWQFQTVRAGQPNSAVSSSPAVVDGKVFFGGEDGILYGLGQGAEVAVAEAQAAAPAPAARAALQGGEWPTPGGDMGFSCVSTDRAVKPPYAVAWKTRTGSVFKAPMIVADGRVYCGGRLGTLIALDAATGEILWKTHHPGVESRPGPTFVDGKLVMLRTPNGQGDSPYVSGASGGPAGAGLWCHDAATGKVLWQQPMTFSYHFNHDGLVAQGGNVFVEQVDAKGEVQAVAIALATGREVWRQTLAVGPPPPKASLKLPPRFSGVLAGGLWCVSVSGRGTLGLDPATGKTVWADQGLFITNRSRLAGRANVLLVFNDAGDHALDARTGKPLWKGAAAATRYSQALTDRYLESKGQQGIYPPAVCAYPVYANGFWYSHHSFTSAHGSNKLSAIREPADGPVGVLTEKMVAWSHEFLSNACPSPTPAYGRLYYSPNAEGVVYCFAPRPEQ